MDSVLDWRLRNAVAFYQSHYTTSALLVMAIVAVAIVIVFIKYFGNPRVGNHALSSYKVGDPVKCTKCWNEYSFTPDARYCPSCGKELEQSSTLDPDLKPLNPKDGPFGL